MSEMVPLARLPASRLARWTLTAFVLTFLLTRILVLLIMTRRIPDLFLHVGQTHVHHLNYGIFLLAGVGAWLLFAAPGDRHRFTAAVTYGIGLGLTFDEFGMWLHLGGSYWQRTSYDAVIVVSALLGLIAFVPTVRQFRARHWAWAVAIALALGAFLSLAVDHWKWVGGSLERIEREAPR
jgi:hypothetical protein